MKTRRILPAALHPSMSAEPQLATTENVPEKEQKRKRHAPIPIPTPLPQLTLQHSNLPVTEVDVNEQPTMEERSGLTWIVKDRPHRQLAKQQLVRLQTESQRSGVGRLSRVVTLRRHWITFEITGARPKCTLRVPVPWVALDNLEGMTHASNYATLPSLPRPHPDFRHLPPFRNDKVNPYEFEIPEIELKQLNRRLRRITNDWNAEAEREGEGIGGASKSGTV
ncbi:uncharacterized protein B0H18DRAFT_959930 [Fomitopsis serialis]|uniref:uncharacterized protein n=1 Tax=Fomitopsis serialis TaxID=139415 RepID=UPI002007D5E0|nr:uncharacterized protein B0H18DRAFT_959930 [Neoantrodia serialis]KAH9914295.1 hypothetical protein B0H18DRAFT_959930 [Neoantrodia serialis]